jgi:hypothetical protein
MPKTRASSNPQAATAPIFRVETTTDMLSSRGGLALFSRYIRNIDIYPQLDRLFGALRKSGKGLPVVALFHQIFCFLADGTSRHLTRFDALKKDEGYARTIETDPDQMASSHAIKRFFYAFGWGRIWLFRRLLRRLFLWRLAQEEPAVVVLGLDTMVMNNDEAEKREGCQVTYKKVKGFQPLQLTWGPYIIDAIFRGGKKNGNAGDVVGKTVKAMVRLLRKHYRADVPIVLRLDSGFFDKKLFRSFEELEIGYICSGKLLDDITDTVREMDASAWSTYHNGRQEWNYVEFGDRRSSWKVGEWRRAFYTRPAYEDETGQRLLKFARPDNVIYTNLGRGERIDQLLEKAGCSEEWTQAEHVIEAHHGRGKDELVHRALKDFRAEQLPFHRFQANAAFYYSILVAFFLFEAFQRDVTPSIVPPTSYATRLRRRAIDFAAKIVRTSHQTILKVTEAVWDDLKIEELWLRAANAPPFVWA